MPGFIYYMHDGPHTFRFELSGDLAGLEVGKLAQAWRTASSTLDGKTLAVDVTFLNSIDEKGRDLLFTWWRDVGARFVANSPRSQTLVESITGLPYAAPGAAVGPTFEPRFTSGSLRAVLLTLTFAATMVFPAKAFASELKRPALDAWDQYLLTANAQMADRATANFLWTEESPDRLRRVSAGEVVVAPLIHAPIAVPGGLIHHWIGAAFIAGARLDDVIGVVRDYDRYPEFYKPSVIGSRTLSRNDSEDRFSVVVVDKAMFMHRALDSDYQSRFVEVNPAKWYSIARTTRVQEMAEQRLIPEGEGSGYIWRLCTMSRYEERAGGVYIEIEVMALSRPIPATLHWLVDPIVRRVSRASLSSSLEQTREATAAAVKSAGALSASRVTSLRVRAANE
jgi:hypothetical protein